MSKILNNIRSLIPYLPSKDVAYGNKFLNIRDFESLKDLVDSAIIRTKKNLKSEQPKEEYIKVNLEKLSSLQAEVNIYLLQLQIPEEDYYDD